jgi:hypothetical protein
MMRNGAPSWLLVLILAITLSSPLIADGNTPVGKTPSWETWGETRRMVSPVSTDGESAETPNQRRRRLGLPIEPSFPSSEGGVNEETPNHRRRRVASESRIELGFAPDLPLK